jgi:hypothetical protein
MLMTDSRVVERARPGNAEAGRAANA